MDRGMGQRVALPAACRPDDHRAAGVAGEGSGVHQEGRRPPPVEVLDPSNDAPPDHRYRTKTQPLGSESKQQHIVAFADTAMPHLPALQGASGHIECLVANRIRREALRIKWQ